MLISTSYTAIKTEDVPLELEGRGSIPPEEIVRRIIREHILGGKKIISMILTFSNKDLDTIARNSD